MEGGGGNDILILLRGIVVGGEGIDIYIIFLVLYLVVYVVIYEDDLDEVSII